MPANRSRTQEWRRCLQQIRDRNGTIEIAVAHDYEDEGEHGNHLVWRVRLLALSGEDIVVEIPSTLGHEIGIQEGVELVVVMAIGQNRWMFRTTCTGQTPFRINAQKTVQALRMAMPTHVERCQRRNYYRVETMELNLPSVEVWPLLDPKSVLVAERANELQFQRDQLGQPRDADLSKIDDESVMPEVGPKFQGMLLNLGGGGMGLRIDPESAQTLNRYKLFWTRFALPPELQTPICATGKLVHTHLESDNYTYAGLAFDFTFNPGHQQFVVDQICRYIAVQQREQLQRQKKSA